jgi:hypothetical protein
VFIEKIPPSKPVGWERIVRSPWLGTAYVILWVLHIFVLTYVQSIGVISKTYQYGGQYLYLTQWINTILAIYWAVCWLDSFTQYFSDKQYDQEGRIIRWAAKHDLTIHRFRDAFFACIAFPISVFVGISFILLINEYGTRLETQFLRVWQHIVITILAFVELFAFGHEFGYGGRVKNGVLIQSLICLALGMIYLIWNFTLSSLNGAYPYTFQDGFTTTTSKVVGYTALLLFVWFLYWVGYWINLIYIPGCCGRKPATEAGGRVSRSPLDDEANQNEMGKISSPKAPVVYYY